MEQELIMTKMSLAESEDRYQEMKLLCARTPTAYRIPRHAPLLLGDDAAARATQCCRPRLIRVRIMLIRVRIIADKGTHNCWQGYA